VALLMANLELVACEMQPGDLLFFHANLLHRSGPNRSAHPGTRLICGYSSTSNSLTPVGFASTPRDSGKTAGLSAKEADLGPLCERRHENLDNLHDIYLNSQDIYVIFGGFITRVSSLGCHGRANASGHTAQRSAPPSTPAPASAPSHSPCGETRHPAPAPARPIPSAGATSAWVRWHGRGTWGLGPA
jgi:hypothetical protein